MLISVSVLCGVGLDLLFGDPPSLPHPVVLMGKCIEALEHILRGIFPKSKRGELWAGVVLAAILPLGTLAVTSAVLWLCGLIHPLLYFAAATVWCWQALAMKGLRDESMMVYKRLAEDSLDDARKAVARIVGRDTAALSKEGIIKAAVETIAENFADGVAAPLLYMTIGGAPLALAYKAINTMDSMVGYKNKKYLHFGCGAARLDDAANYIPARLAALLLCGAAWLCHQDGKGAFRIWRRDRRKHASPNSAQTEAAMAGALGVQLAGPAYYFGELHEKPTIGDSTEPVKAQDIVRANRLMYTAGIALTVLLCALRMLISLL